MLVKIKDNAFWIVFTMLVVIKIIMFAALILGII